LNYLFIRLINSLNVLCRTVFTEKKISDLNVHQSEYRYAWNSSKSKINIFSQIDSLTLKQRLQSYYFFYRFLIFLNNLFKLIGFKNENRLSKKNRELDIIKF
jgi:hypothetical protein